MCCTVAERLSMRKKCVCCVYTSDRKHCFEHHDANLNGQLAELRNTLTVIESRQNEASLESTLHRFQPD